MLTFDLSGGKSGEDESLRPDANGAGGGQVTPGILIRDRHERAGRRELIRPWLLDWTAAVSFRA